MTPLAPAQPTIGPSTIPPAGRRQALLVLIALVAAFVSLALVLPIWTESPIVDEPIYAESAFEWARTGTIEISGLSAPNSVFDTIWGGLFARALAESYEALRISTIVLTAISGPFMYWLARQLRASRSLSLVATGAYLFSPLVVVLSATFMTDAHFMALMVIAAAFHVHGLNRSPFSTKFLAIGSVFTTLAFLSRPQALILPLAAAIVIVRRLESRRAVLSLVAVAAIPMAAFFLHGRWTAHVGEPFIRALSAHAFVKRVTVEAAPFSGRLLLMASVYVGLLSLPMVPLLRMRPLRVGAGGAVRLFLAGGLLALFLAMMLTGYDLTESQQWMTPNGLGAVERTHLGDRPLLWPGWIQGTLGLAAVMGTYLWVVNVVPRQSASGSPARVFLGLLGLGLLGAAVAASMTLHSSIFDRYWLPLIPLLLAGAAATGVTSRVRVLVASGLAVLVGLFGIIATHDALVAYEAVANFAEDSVEDLGISPLEFEGGAAWSAQTFGVSDEGPKNILERSGPFWVKFYAVETRPEYGVTLEPLDGYEVLSTREFPSILHLEPTFVYLVRGDPDVGYFLDADDF